MAELQRRRQIRSVAADPKRQLPGNLYTPGYPLWSTAIASAVKNTPFGTRQKYTQGCTDISGPPEGYSDETVVKYSNYTSPSLQANWSFPTYSHSNDD